MQGTADVSAAPDKKKNGQTGATQPSRGKAGLHYYYYNEPESGRWSMSTISVSDLTSKSAEWLVEAAGDAMLVAGRAGRILLANESQLGAGSTFFFTLPKVGTLTTTGESEP